MHPSEKVFESSISKITPNANIVYPTKEQDMFEHWDIMVNDNRYDVKSMKRFNRSDKEPSEKIFWVELTNVRGNKGWLYGKAEYIAFEIQKGFIIVETNKLRKLVEDNITNEIGKGIYKRYSRRYRLDEVTLVPREDIIKITDKIIYK